MATCFDTLERSCTEQAIVVDEWMQDSGSGMNYKRKQFIHLFELIEQGRVKTLLKEVYFRLDGSMKAFFDSKLINKTSENDAQL